MGIFRKINPSKIDFFDVGNIKALDMLDCISSLFFLCWYVLVNVHLMTKIQLLFGRGKFGRDSSQILSIIYFCLWVPCRYQSAFNNIDIVHLCLTSAQFICWSSVWDERWWPMRNGTWFPRIVSKGKSLPFQIVV